VDSNNGKAEAIRELQRNQRVFEREQIEQGKQLSALDTKVTMMSEVNAQHHMELKQLIKDRDKKCDKICAKNEEVIEYMKKALITAREEHINDLNLLDKRVDKMSWFQKVFKTTLGKVLGFLIASGAVTAIGKVIWDLFTGG
jgi:hypothetical protein